MWDSYEKIIFIVAFLIGLIVGRMAASIPQDQLKFLEETEPVKVKPGEIKSIIMDYEPQPNEFHIEQISVNQEIEVVFKNNRFIAPLQKRIYYYSYGIWMMDEKEERLSHDDAFYAFVLEID